MKLKELKDLVIRKTGQNIDLVSRKTDVINARAMYFFLARRHTNYTLGSILKSIDAITNHATVLNAIKKFETYIMYDEDFNILYNDVKSVIEQYKANECDSIIDAENELPATENDFKNETGLIKFKSFKFFAKLLEQVDEQDFEVLETRLIPIINSLNYGKIQKDIP